MSEKGFRVEVPVHIKRDRRARKVLAKGETPEPQESPARMARLLALAWKWELTVRRGTTSYAEIARRHRLSRARVCQICSLRFLTPDIQKTVLSSETAGWTPLRRLAAVPDWDLQHSLAHKLRRNNE